MPSTPTPSPSPSLEDALEQLSRLDARLSLLEALLLHQIPGDERRAMLEDLANKHRDDDRFRDIVTHLEGAEELASTFDSYWKYPNHQGA